MNLKYFSLLLLIGAAFAFPSEETAPAADSAPAPAVAEDPAPIADDPDESADEPEGEADATAEEVAEESDEFECKYEDPEEGNLTITFRDSEEGEVAISSSPEGDFDINEKLELCLGADIEGRKTRKPVRRRRPGVRRRPGKRKPGRKGKPGKKSQIRESSLPVLLRQMKQTLKGKTVDVTMPDMVRAIQLGRRYIEIKARRNRNRKNQKRLG